MQAAVLYGSFLKHQVFRDIDIAIYTGYAVKPDHAEAYQEQLSQQLEKLVGLPVDVKVIDYAPPWFRAEALKGKTLVEKTPALTARLRFKAIQETLDIKAKQTSR